MAKPITFDPDDPEAQWILSCTCIFCGPIAHVLQRAGWPIKTRAEDEQRAVITWMLELLQEHGIAWRVRGQEQLKAMREAPPAAQQSEKAADT